MELCDIRKQIDAIDTEFVDLFIKRMELSAKVADYKKAHNMPIFVPEREQEILASLSQKAGSDMALYVRSLYQKIFELSRDYQNDLNSDHK